jgi:hypothetical protein
MSQTALGAVLVAWIFASGHDGVTGGRDVAPSPFTFDAPSWHDWAAAAVGTLFTGEPLGVSR